MMLREYIKEIENKHNIKVIYVTIYGSKLYGTDNENSDTDYKGIFIPNKEDVLLKKDIDNITYSSGDDNSKNGAEDFDIQLFSIYKFFNLLKKGETGVLDLLFSMFRFDTIKYEDKKYTNIIRNNKDNLIHKNIHAFTGYANSMARKYKVRGDRYNELLSFKEVMNNNCVKSDNSLEEFPFMIEDICKDNNYNHIKVVLAPGPDKNELIRYLSILGKKFPFTVSFNYLLERIEEMEAQYGSRVKQNENSIDYKGLSHSVRVLLECEEYLETGFITFPLKERTTIKNIKDGEIHLDKIMELLEFKLEFSSKIKSSLPEKINAEVIDKIILDFV